MNKSHQTTGTWLKKLTRALSGEAQDRDDLVNSLRDAGAQRQIPTVRQMRLKGRLEGNK